MSDRTRIAHQLRMAQEQLARTPEYIGQDRPVNSRMMNYLATHPRELLKLQTGGKVVNPEHRRLEDEVKRLTNLLKRLPE